MFQKFGKSISKKLSYFSQVVTCLMTYRRIEDKQRQYGGGHLWHLLAKYDPEGYFKLKFTVSHAWVLNIFNYQG